MTPRTGVGGGLAELVAQVRSASEVQRYKPQVEVYALLPEDATLIAAHAWDVAGAVATGRRAVWANRAGRPWPYEATLIHEEASDLVTAIKRLRRPPD